MHPSLWPGALDSIGNILAHLPTWVFFGGGGLHLICVGQRGKGCVVPDCSPPARPVPVALVSGPHQQTAGPCDSPQSGSPVPLTQPCTPALPPELPQHLESPTDCRDPCLPKWGPSDPLTQEKYARTLFLISSKNPLFEYVL